MKRTFKNIIAECFAWVLAIVLYIIPFTFMIFNSLKDRKAASKLKLTIPDTIVWTNYSEVIKNNNYEILRAFKNSLLLAALGVLTLVICGSMAAYVIQRRNTRVTRAVNAMMLFGLMVPMSILPTIWVLRALHIYKTLFSMVMLEASLSMPFTVMLYKGFIDNIPRELEEAGRIDGCSAWGIYWRIVLPLLKPVTSTAVILNAVTIFNDFTHPLYFYPGKANVTVQLTLYNYIGQYSSSYNLLFADVVLITLPMLILFLFCNRRIIAGMVAGSVKG